MTDKITTAAPEAARAAYHAACRAARYPTADALVAARL